MKFGQGKDSIYEIQPWAEESSTIPNRFLHAQHFAKTSYPKHSALKSRPQLEITTNTVYIIKNQEEILPNASKIKSRAHRTTNNSPKVRQNVIQLPHHTSKNALIPHVSVQSTSQLLKKRQKNPEMFTPIAHTKKIIFDIKSPKAKERYRKMVTCQSKPEKEGLNSNLIKIYERSTMTHDQKKQTRIERIEIDEICQRRKLKTQKESDTSPKRHLLISLKPQHLPDGQSQLSGLKPEGVKSSSFFKEKVTEPQVSQKMKMQLVLERKLFVLRNNLNQCQFKPKGAQSPNRASN